MTDALLLELHRRFPQIAVRRLTPAHEKRLGADWEWWIGSPTDGWLCLRIQAKRIYDVGYRALDHPGEQDGHYQYDTLIDSCQDPYTLPYHVFYNGWEATRFGELRDNRADLRALRNNQHFPHEDGPRRRGDDDPRRLGSRLPNWWGCAAMSTYRVAALHSRNQDKPKRVYAPRYLRHAMPWSCLFGSDSRMRDLADPSGASSMLDQIHQNLLADAAESARVARHRYDSRHIQLTQQLEALEQDMDHGEGRAHRHPELPPYAAMILSRHEPRISFDREFRLYRAPANYALVTDIGTFRSDR
ncbi:DUF6615 family protein [Nocardia wallacei]|uniref:DUF6615 family protein n=1 Tax=Nocardia wallacei TaxID=480035 RepID=UPI0024557334|nr:DUF6615 family protein [Nocardia wallacei]